MDHLGKKLYKFPFAQKYCWLNLGRQVPYHWEVSPSPFPIPYNPPLRAQKQISILIHSTKPELPKYQDWTFQNQKVTEQRPLWTQI